MKRVTTTDITRLDSLLQAAQLYRLSEQGRARDVYGGLAEQADADGRKLNAFTVGVLDGLLTSHDAHTSLLPVLVYALVVSEHGPGERAVDAAKHMLALERYAELRTYITLGRHTVIRAFAGEPAEPGAYAELLLSELTRN
jgi:hypothetical protein